MKAHNPFAFEAEYRGYDQTQARVSVNNGSTHVGLGLAYVSGIGNGTYAALTPEMARKLGQDLIERADELDPPKELTLRTQRTATAEEVDDMINGTGALTWSWWTDATREARNGVDGWLFVHDDEGSGEGAGDCKTWVSDQQIVDAAARYIAEGRLQEDVADVMTESIGYLDAVGADQVLQYAVHNRGIFG